MNVAIFGATGLLGRSLVSESLRLGYSTRGFSRSASNSPNFLLQHFHVELFNFERIELECERLFAIWHPDVIINTIAHVNLKDCELDYALAEKANSLIGSALAAVSEKLCSYYIHISTDHYYNDSKNKHNESDKVLLLNNYAKTKHQAECNILNIAPSSLIVRTNIIGFRKSRVPSFFEWLLKGLEQKKELILYSNFKTSPISVNFLSKILLNCSSKKISGVYNIAGSGVVSKYEFGLQTAKTFGLSNVGIIKEEYSPDENCVSRALTLGLDVSKIERALNKKMPSIQESLDQLYKEYRYYRIRK